MLTDIDTTYKNRNDEIRNILTTLNSTKLQIQYTLCIIKSNCRAKVIHTDNFNFNELKMNNEECFQCMLFDFNNNYLKDILVKEGYKFFVPHCTPTFNFSNNVLELYYYHNADEYNSIYISNYPDLSFINEPTEFNRETLEELYVEGYRMIPIFPLINYEICAE